MPEFSVRRITNSDVTQFIQDRLGRVEISVKVEAGKLIYLSMPSVNQADFDHILTELKREHPEAF